MDIYDFFEVVDYIYEYNISSIDDIKSNLHMTQMKLNNIINILIDKGIICIDPYNELITLVPYEEAVDILYSL